MSATASTRDLPALIRTILDAEDRHTLGAFTGPEDPAARAALEQIIDSGATDEDAMRAHDLIHRLVTFGRAW